MEKVTVVVIGGGATGLGILRDLSMRGVKALLVEKRDLINGASSRYHGLLHSGGRYAVKDQSAARECIIENQILRKIGKSCVESCGGMFTRLDIDDPAYEELWVKGCADSGIEATPITLDEAFKLEPRLSRKHIKSAYLVPDAAIDGFRMAWQLIDSSKKYGGQVKTYTEVIGFDTVNGELRGVKVRNQFTGEEYEIACDIAVNAAGGWAGIIGKLAGVEIGVQPDKGTLIAFNQRIVNHVVNRLHKSSDGDIFVPHGSITILGTSSMSVPDPEDTSTSREEVENLLKIGEQTFEDLRDFRILRTFAGSRPLYIPPGGAMGRSASRGFAIVDHERDGLKGLFTIVGGKFTTFRLMAEKICDKICAKLNVKEPCRTAEEPFVPEVTAEDKKIAKKFFPSYGMELAADRLGAERFKRVVERLKNDPESRELVCECENVTRAEVEEICKEDTSFIVNDVRRRTRIGMGTCQGNFCALRAAAVFAEVGVESTAKDSLVRLREFLQGRWKGIRPILLGRTLRETEMTRAIYELSMNVTGGEPQ
ncbi:MAG: anaerobic glycerol-3-phosphate dehydrogenase subunit A [Selenomonadaceae bacterium]|nr:anaerobic glycerol-3-phosphate dehydrogenase subunit A [Selenomonadaceae bacterium]